MKTITQPRLGLLLLALVVVVLCSPLAAPARAGLNQLLPQPFDAAKSVNATTARPGTSVSYTLSLVNPTGLDLTEVAITDTLPIALTYNPGSLTATIGSFNFASGVITWTGSISAGVVATITYGATLSNTLLHGAVITNSALITGGGELLTRTATLLVSTNTYLPLIRFDPTQTPTPTPTPTSTPTPTPTATAAPNTWQTLIYEGFEGNFPGPWTLYANNNGVSWGQRGCRVFMGNYSGWGAGANIFGGGALGCGSNYPDNVRAWMVYGPFSLAGYSAAELRSKLWINSEASNDYLCQFASIDGYQFYGYCHWGNTGGWVERVQDLTNVYTLGNLTGRPNVWVALFFQSNGSINTSEGGYADDVLLRRCASGCTGVSSVPPRSPNDRSVQVPSTLTRPK